MAYPLYFTAQADADYEALQSQKHFAKGFNAVRKALAYLDVNPRHPGLKTHKYSAISGPNGEEIFEAYVENTPPAAYRIFWFYGPDKDDITIVAITAHP